VSEKERSLDCHQIHLDGEPWSHFSRTISYDDSSKKFDSFNNINILGIGIKWSSFLVKSVCGKVVMIDPGRTHNSSYGLHARSLMILLLRAANCRGWKMVASVDVSAKCNPTVSLVADPIKLFFSSLTKNFSIVFAVKLGHLIINYSTIPLTFA